MDARAPYTVRTDAGEFRCDDRREVAATASDHVEGAADPVEVLDRHGNIVDASEVMDWIFEHRRGSAEAARSGA